MHMSTMKVRGKMIITFLPWVMSQAGDSGMKKMSTRKVRGKMIITPARVRQWIHFTIKTIYIPIS